VVAVEPLEFSFPQQTSRQRVPGVQEGFCDEEMSSYPAKVPVISFTLFH
jgi:hypothetical protein